jgi:ribonuclease HII
VLPVQPNQKSHILFDGTNSKTPKEEKREELFETLKVNDSIRWVVDIIDQR